MGRDSVSGGPCAAKPYFTFTGPFASGWGSSAENPDTCLLNETITRSANLSSFTEITCTAKNDFGEKKSKTIIFAPYNGNILSFMN